MKASSTSALILLEMISVTLLPALKAQKLKVLPKVTGYLGHDVTLPCRFEGSANISQIQWDLLEPNRTKIGLFNPNFGEFIHPPLKDKVQITKQSLIFKDVEMRNAGLYKCSVATFPSGSFAGTTTLIVREQMPLSPGVVSAIVIAVVLLVGIVAAVTYFIFIRRRESSASHRVFIDTGGTVIDEPGSSSIQRAEDMVYAHVKFKQPRREMTLNNDEHRKSSNVDEHGKSSNVNEHGKSSNVDEHRKSSGDNVTYADVKILGQKPK